jgi:glycyl-tRNA synthetase
MTTEEVTNWQDEVDALNASITKQGAELRLLKKNGGDADDIAAAVEALKGLKIQAEALAKLQVNQENVFARKAFDDLILRKMFVVPSFEIHGGVKGLFDLGPPACALKVSNIYNNKVYRLK